MRAPDILMAIIVAGVLLAAIGFGFWFRSYLRAERTREAIREQERIENEIAPELRMQAVKWAGIAAPPDELSEGEMAEKIKAALLERKIHGDKR